MEQNVHTETKVCSKCKRELPTSEFYKASNAKDGFYGYCKECSREQVRKHKMKRRGQMTGLPKNFLESASGGGIDNPLSAFSPRELMEELRRRGYRGKLEYTSVIDIENF